MSWYKDQIKSYWNVSSLLQAPYKQLKVLKTDWMFSQYIFDFTCAWIEKWNQIVWLTDNDFCESFDNKKAEGNWYSFGMPK